MLGSYVRFRLFVIILIAVIIFIFYLLLALSGADTGIVLYGVLLCFAVCLAAAAADAKRFTKKHALLEGLQNRTDILREELPESSDLIEKDYQELVFAILKDRADMVSRSDRKMQGMTEYYTLWAHQIKTPIAAMRLLLQAEGAADEIELKDELFKIETYADMVLQYLRSESESTDFVIKRYELDGIIKQAVIKYAPQFIRKKISLDYADVSAKVVTDEKWLLFVIEQIISNALKYTNSGKVSIYMEENALVIEDTGIGIQAEDLLRIFENGFTGYNGRADKKATGIGLYLCRRICGRLGHTIEITSSVGTGTKVKIGLWEEAFDRTPE